MTKLQDFLYSNPLINQKVGRFYFQKNIDFASFQKNYIPLRQKEGRLHSDEEASHLPFVSNAHSHYREWLLRQKSTDQLIRHFKKHGSITILEIGCGNGWLANQLATSLNAEVCAMDVNEFELEQGKRVFKNDKLDFLLADVFSDVLPGHYFDAIIFASSIQYFADLEIVLKRIFGLLKLNGEIHIFDSPFYKGNDRTEAQKRSENYFDQLGYPEMAKNYFHHSLQELDLFDWFYEYNPASIKNRIRRKITLLSPFPWIVVKGV
jgi:ubiquinone/menaquinone biosynthesis C-methylase UbiE